MGIELAVKGSMYKHICGVRKYVKEKCCTIRRSEIKSKHQGVNVSQ